jgi:MFS family permease
LVSYASWRFVFGINVVPITIALILLTRLNLAENRDADTRIDRPGIALGALGLAGVVYALIERPAFGITNPLIIGPFVAGIALLVGFILHERRAVDPMLPLSLFTVRNFSVGNFATFLIYAALSLQGFALVIFLQQVPHYSPTEAGLAGLPISLLMFALSSRFGALAGKYGPRLFMAVGPIIAGIGTLLFATTDASANYWVQILPGILLIGLGLSITVAPLTAAILGSIASQQAGIGSAVNNAVARIAGLMSVALIGVVAGSALNLNGFHRSVIFCSILLIAGGIVSALGIQNTTVLARETTL